MKRESKTFEKSVALKFLGDESLGSSFISDVECNYYAPELVYLFQNVSIVIMGIFTSIAGAYIFHKLHQEAADKKSKEELVNRIRDILKENENKLEEKLKIIEDKIEQLDERDKQIIEITYRQNVANKKENRERCEIGEEIVSARKTRLNKYLAKAKRLKPSNEYVDLIIEILEHEYKKDDREREQYIDKFRWFKEKKLK